jgi:hypothetical protein
MIGGIWSMPISFTDSDEWSAEYQNATPEGKAGL